MNSPSGRERRRHVRVDGRWPVLAHAVEHNGAVHTFPAMILNVSLSGVLLEAAVAANLWADKPLGIELPGGVGLTHVAVRRFVEYGDHTHATSRWGVELTRLTVQQRVYWARFVYTAARESGHALAEMVVRVAASPVRQPSESAIRAAAGGRAR